MNNTKERPIALTAQEVNAVLAGDKTQHRMMIENTKDTQCLFNGDWRYDGRDFLDSDGFTPDPKGAHYVERLEPSEGEERQYTEDYRCVGHCPFGVVGDRLWVKELHARTDCNDYLTRPHYYADGPLTLDLRHDAGLLIKYSANDMPRWASRIFLEITDIRIERVRDIDAASAEVEGCFNFASYERFKQRPLSAFITYWMAKHGDDAWWDNPWVWVIEFKAIKESDNGHN